MEILVDKIKSFRLTESSKEKICFGICLVCMFLFIFSAYEKVISHQRFYSGLAKVAIIGSAAKIIAWSVPIAEFIISILLIIPQTCRKGLGGFIGVMGIFTVYILSMWIWAAELPCHCNLLVENLTWGQHVWFNLAFIGLAIFALKLQKINLKL